jgi:hypothetical protein
MEIFARLTDSTAKKLEFPFFFLFFLCVSFLVPVSAIKTGSIKSDVLKNLNDFQKNNLGELVERLGVNKFKVLLEEPDGGKVKGLYDLLLKHGDSRAVKQFAEGYPAYLDAYAEGVSKAAKRKAIAKMNSHFSKVGEYLWENKHFLRRWGWEAQKKITTALGKVLKPDFYKQGEGIVEVKTFDWSTFDASKIKSTFKEGNQLWRQLERYYSTLGPNEHIKLGFTFEPKDSAIRKAIVEFQAAFRDKIDPNFVAIDFTGKVIK